MSRCSLGGKRKRKKREREKSPPLFDPNFFTRNQTSKYIYIYILREIGEKSVAGLLIDAT